MRKLWARFRENRDVAAVNALVNLTKALGALMAFLVPAGLVSQLQIPVWVKALLGCTILIFALIFLGYLWGRRRNPHVSAWRKQLSNPHLEVLERHELCHVISYTTYELFYDLKLNVTGEHADAFNFYTEWTGRDDLKIRVESSDFNAVETGRRPLAIRTWKIVFDRRRYKGETVDLRYSISSDGNVKEEENFLSHTFRETDAP